MSVTFKSYGDFHSTRNFLNTLMKKDIVSILKKYGEMGVGYLATATPKRTGKTAASWSYEIKRTKDGYELSWTNSNVQNGLNIALLIQYGHGTRGGGWVEGIDYINPVIKPIFDQLSQELRGGE